MKGLSFLVGMAVLVLATSAFGQGKIPPRRPVITVHPASQTVIAGNALLLSVEVAESATALTYQWQRNGTNIPGATAATFRIGQPAADDAGDYAVLVTNGSGSTPSNPATITVVTPGGNNHFADRIRISGTNTTVQSENVQATAESGEPLHGGVGGGKTVWWTWTSPISGPVTIQTVNSWFPKVLAVYTGTSLTNLSVVASNIVTEINTSAQVTLNAVRDTSYQIAVDGLRVDASFSYSGSIGLSVLATLPPLVTINSPPADAQFRSGTNIVIAFQASDPDGFIQRLQLQTNGLFAGNINTRLSQVTLTNLPPGRYTIALSAYDNSGAVSVARRSFQIKAANDDFENRQMLVGENLTVETRNYAATRQPGEPRHANADGHKSLWWSWQSPKSGPVFVSTRGSDYNAVLAVYTGEELTALRLVASDSFSGGDGSSSASFTAAAGTVYHVAVDQYSASGGDDQNGQKVMLGIFSTSPPRVRIVSPIRDAIYEKGATVLLSLEAQDDDGLIRFATIEGYGLGNFQFTNMPFEVTITNAPSGRYYLRASATDDVGASGAAVVSFRVRGDPPPNDQFRDRILVAGTNIFFEGTNSWASKELDEPNHAGNAGGSSIWWKWIAPKSGAVTLEGVNTYFNQLLAVYMGATLFDLAQEAATYGYPARLRFQATAGVEYSIALDSYRYSESPGDEGQARLHLVMTEPPLAGVISPANNSVIRLSNVGARTNVVAQASASDLDGSIVSVTVSVSGSGSAYYYSATLTNAPYSALLTNLGLGSYYISVTAIDNAGASSSEDANFTVAGPPPVNDDFASRIILAGTNIIQTTENRGATREAGEPIPFSGSGGKSLWWSWIAPAAGLFIVDTVGSSFDTTLGIYSGASLGALTFVASNDDALPENKSRITLNAVANRIYHIMVDGYGTSSGDIQLNLHGPILAPSNDHFANRIRINGTSYSTNATTIGATRQTGEPAHGGSSSSGSIWWTWRAPVSCGLVIDVDAQSFFPYITVYRGTVLTSLQQHASWSGSGEHSVAVQGGVDYQIVFSGSGDSSGDFSFDLRTSTAPPVFISQPLPRTELEGRAVTFAPEVTGIGPLSYLWQKDGTNLTASRARILQLRNITMNDAGVYRLIVTNLYSGATSAPVQLTVLRDLEPPRLLAARTFGSYNTIRLIFSEPLNRASVLNSTNYVMSHGVNLFTYVQDIIHPELITLATTPLPPAGPLRIQVFGVKDLALNEMPPGEGLEVDFRPAPFVQLSETVPGYQDDFEGSRLSGAWKIQGFTSGQVFEPRPGLLRVTPQPFNNIQLLLDLPGYDDSIQDVVARVRIKQFASGSDPYVGLVSVANSNSTESAGYVFRNEGTLGRHTEFLHGNFNWGQEVSFRWSSNIWYWMRLHHEPEAGGGAGDAFGKIWADDGVATEPYVWSSWNYTPTRAAARGKAGLITRGSSSGGMELEVDYVLIQAAGLPQITPRPANYKPKPALGARPAGPNSLELLFLSAPQAVLNLESSTDLAIWTPVLTFTNHTGSGGLTQPIGSAPGRNFYRLIAP